MRPQTQTPALPLIVLGALALGLGACQTGMAPPPDAQPHAAYKVLFDS